MEAVASFLSGHSFELASLFIGAVAAVFSALAFIVARVRTH